MEMQIGNSTSLWLLWIVVAAVALVLYAGWVRQRAALRFVSNKLRSQIIPAGAGWRQMTSALLVAASLVLIALSLLDIRWGKTTRVVPQKGIEVMFVLDVSRSMLAEDVSPNRLSRAKDQIRDMLDEMAGDRVGLVVFAGEATQSVPMTNHYEDFKQTLDAVNPSAVGRGGSRLGDALTVAGSGFLSKTNDHKAIVLFTDGEDQESQPIEVAKKLKADLGVRVFAIGLGDVDQGARIPDDASRQGSYLQYEGQQVWTKLNGKTLNQIASETGGAYIPAGTRRVNMADVYHGYVAQVEQSEFESARINTYVARYQWFAAPALFFLLLDVIWSTRVPRSLRKTATQLTLFAIGSLAIAPACGLAQTSTIPAPATQSTTLHSSSMATADSASQINAANALVRAGNFQEALLVYQQVAASDEQQETLKYNMAVAHYRQGDLESAEKLFGEVANSNNADTASRGRYNVGNCRYQQALKQAETDKPRAIENLRRAIESYRSSLLGNSSHTDARANIELAGQLIRKLQQEQEQQDQQNQDQQQQNQENKDHENKDQENKDQPNEKRDQDQHKQDQQNDEQNQDQQKQDHKQDQQKPDQQKQDQNEEQPASQQEKQENSAEDKSGSNSAQPPSDAGQGVPQSKSAEKPSEKKKPVEQGNPNDQPEQDVAPDQPKSTQAAGDDKDPTGELAAADPKNKSQTESATSVETLDANAPMTKEEALKMLQAVRDRDMLRRLQQQRRERWQHVPVDRDW